MNYINVFLVDFFIDFWVGFFTTKAVRNTADLMQGVDYLELRSVCSSPPRDPSCAPEQTLTILLAF